MSADISRFIDPDQLYHRAAASLYGMTGAQPEQTAPVSGQEVLELSCFIAALIISGDPRLNTNQKLRETGQALGAAIAGYARAIREHDAKGGKPVMAWFSEGGQGFVAPEPGALTN